MYHNVVAGICRMGIRLGKPENPLRKMHLVGLTSKRKVQWRPSTMGTS